ncbi:unnamed protein product [Durusdinium trenchii]|uniref:Uncharacterized protein n=2 Tax=Durusdinium trenchii TaxID=1381693 RepID=A0ABP0SZ91_9DINO
MLPWRKVSEAWFRHAWGHPQLQVRGWCVSVKTCLTVLLCLSEIDVDHRLWIGICQFICATSLFLQWWLANPTMFLVRSMANFAKAFLFLHLSVCGRTAIFDPAACELAGWQDERQPFRIINACFILHWILVAISLLLQFLLPLKGVTVDVGHEQLWYRARLRATAASRLEVSGQVATLDIWPRVAMAPQIKSIVF